MDSDNNFKKVAEKLKNFKLGELSRTKLVVEPEVQGKATAKATNSFEFLDNMINRSIEDKVPLDIGLISHKMQSLEEKLDRLSEIFNPPISRNAKLFNQEEEPGKMNTVSHQQNISNSSKPLALRYTSTNDDDDDDLRSDDFDNFIEKLKNVKLGELSKLKLKVDPEVQDEAQKTDPDNTMTQSNVLEKPHEETEDPKAVNTQIAKQLLAIEDKIERIYNLFPKNDGIKDKPCEEHFPSDVTKPMAQLIEHVMKLIRDKQVVDSDKPKENPCSLDIVKEEPKKDMKEKGTEKDDTLSGRAQSTEELDSLRTKTTNSEGPEPMRKKEEASVDKRTNRSTLPLRLFSGKIPDCRRKIKKKGYVTWPSEEDLSDTPNDRHFYAIRGNQPCVKPTNLISEPSDFDTGLSSVSSRTGVSIKQTKACGTSKVKNSKL